MDRFVIRNPTPEQLKPSTSNTGSRMKQATITSLKIRPHPAVTMLVEPENGNRFDPYAMKVMMPTLANIPTHLHQEVTRPGSQRHSQPQTVADIAGKQVGRVPANLCRAFRIITERQLYTEVTCVYNNYVGVSRNPRPEQNFERRFNARSPTLDRDLPGGGAELNCSYIINVHARNFEETMHTLEQHVGVDVLDNKLFA